jgi:hypothetical protein
MKSPQWVRSARDRADQLNMVAGQARGWAQRTIFWRVWERMLENEFIDRGVALAPKAFVSFFPAVIVVAAFAPGRLPGGRLPGRGRFPGRDRDRLPGRGQPLMLSRPPLAGPAPRIEPASGAEPAPQTGPEPDS